MSQRNEELIGQIADAFVSGNENASMALAGMLPHANSLAERRRIAQEITAAAVGDEEAIGRLAQRLSGGKPVPMPVDPEFPRAAYAHRNDERNADLYGDPEMKAELYRFDSELAQKDPDMTPEYRLQVAGEIVRRRGGGEDRTAQDGIEFMQKSGRHMVHHGAPASEQRGSAEIAEEEILEDRADAIAEMARSRMPHKVTDEERARFARMREDAEQRRRRGG